ncbi:GFA family protein [Chondromyces crocatus]|uniref:Aldehyde-activating protein n=1 Tax=Chondromyces crocatus TaxID=52 RepID=A0A0K1EHW1_CHOCO|nr:GFA family protein [Chondromyces crocatus]AKT40461.1 aldehyde-activating protein [Chondromyces crocatus]
MDHDDTTRDAAATNATRTLHGSCHCGLVRFEVDHDPTAEATGCNCVNCTKVGVAGLIVNPAAFRLVQGEDALGMYTWGASGMRRYFCNHCGVHGFVRGNVAELGGEYVSVSLHSIDGVEITEVKVAHWDGRHDNWQAGPRETPWPILDAEIAVPVEV